MSDDFKNINSFPLSWPMERPRSKTRKRSRFTVGFERARKMLFNELKLMGVPDWNVILSTNIPTRRDGMPYAGVANPQDSGVAVYFRYKNKPFVFCCDTYIKVVDNLYAIAMTIHNIRGIERWGAGDMLERAFTGFTALPPAQSKERPKRDWYDILGVGPDSSGDEVRQAYRNMCFKHHPDRGGDKDSFHEIQDAYNDAQRRGLV